MNQAPFYRLKSGHPVRAAEHNRVLDAAERLLNLEGPGLDFGTAGPKFREPEPFHKWGKITEGPDDRGRYSCLELDLTRGGDALAVADKPGGMLWQPSYVPAYNAAGTAVTPGTVVKLRRGTGDFWVFNYCCGPVESGASGRGSGGFSGSGVPLPGLCLNGLIQPPIPPFLYLSWSVETGSRPPGTCLGNIECIPPVFPLGYQVVVQGFWQGFFQWPLFCEGGILNPCRLTAIVQCAGQAAPDKLNIGLGAGILPYLRYTNNFSSERPIFHTFTITAEGPLDCMDVCRTGQTVWRFFLTE